MASSDLSPDGATSQRQPQSEGGLWQNRDFLLLFSAQVISLMGSGVTTVALALFAYELTGGADATVVVGTALMLRIVAFLLFSQLAGVYADRVSRKQILILMDVGRFALLGLFPFVTQVWQVYVLIFLINALTACFTPTYEATIPQVVGPRAYTKAIALSRVAVDVEAILGPVLAGTLVAAFGVRWVFLLDGLTYLVSALLILMVAIPRLITPVSTPRLTLARDILYGSRILFGEPSLRQALIVSFCEATAGAAAIVATVAYVRGELKQSDFMVAATMAAVGVGSALAAICLARLGYKHESVQASPDLAHQHIHRRAARMLLGSGILLSMVLLAAGTHPPLWLFALLWAANGVGQAMIALPSSLLLAEHTSDFERGRAYAAHFALTHACWLVTYPAVGYAAAKWGTSATFIAAGIVCVLTTLVAWLAGRGTDGPHTHNATTESEPRDRMALKQEFQNLPSNEQLPPGK